MFRFQAAAGVMVVLALAACGSSAPISSKPVDVTFTGNPKISQVAGYTPMTVRAERKVEKTRTEMSGVPCQVEGTGFRAAVVTPGIVNMPDLRAQTRPVTVTCTADGVSRSQVVQPYSITSKGNTNAAAGAGVLGMVVGGIVESARDKSGDSFGYDDVRVEF